MGKCCRDQDSGVTFIQIQVCADLAHALTMTIHVRPFMHATVKFLACQAQIEIRPHLDTSTALHACN